jgi:hypothetical protein
MANKFDRYKEDLQKLLKRGGDLTLSLQAESDPTSTKKALGDGGKIEILPDVRSEYESWYSECTSLVSQLLPDRIGDFISYYKPLPSRKDISHANYTMSDYLRQTTVRRGGEIIVGPSSALNPMYQQFNIIKGIANRFDSMLFDIVTLVQADIMDDELHAADELNTKGFQRGAGAIAGVVLEGHLGLVCERHNIAVKKKDPSISDYNDALKNASVIDVAAWRFNQHLGDIRNKCDHKKLEEPAKNEVHELIAGVRKVTKTIF